VIDFLENRERVEACVRALVRNPILPPPSKRTVTTESCSQKLLVHSTGLHLAAYFGLDKALDILLQRGNSPDPKDSFNITPFMLAAMNGREGAVRLLVKTCKVDVDAKDDIGQTALVRAARYGHLSIARLLLEIAKLGINWRDEDGRTPLFQAARKGNDDVMRLLLSSDKVDPNIGDRYGSTPLSMAARNGQEQEVKLLLMKEGIQFDLVDKFGRTPIFWAASKGHLRIVERLLEKYKEARVFICEDDLPKLVGRVSSTEGHINCNICATDIADNENHFHCKVCQSGDFDNSHKLVERCMEDILKPVGYESV
jgi:ankyrin repeat protein